MVCFAYFKRSTCHFLCSILHYSVKCLSLNDTATNNGHSTENCACIIEISCINSSFKESFIDIPMPLLLEFNNSLQMKTNIYSNPFRR